MECSRRELDAVAGSSLYVANTRPTQIELHARGPPASRDARRRFPPAGRNTTPAFRLDRDRDRVRGAEPVRRERAGKEPGPERLRVEGLLGQERVRRNGRSRLGVADPIAPDVESQDLRGREDVDVKQDRQREGIGSAQGRGVGHEREAERERRRVICRSAQTLRCRPWRRRSPPSPAAPRIRRCRCRRARVPAAGRRSGGWR
jgi:hypothetical protein